MHNNAMNALGHPQDMFLVSLIQSQPICSYSFGLYIHNGAMNTLGRPQDTFLDIVVQLQPIFAQFLME